MLYSHFIAFKDDKKIRNTQQKRFLRKKTRQKENQSPLRNDTKKHERKPSKKTRRIAFIKYTRSLGASTNCEASRSIRRKKRPSENVQHEKLVERESDREVNTRL